MGQTFGIEARHVNNAPDSQPPVRFLVLIDSAAENTRLARLFLDSRQQVAEFDAAGPEVLSIIDGLLSQQEADGTQWDQALAGHTAEERRAAQVFTLAV